MRRSRLAVELIVSALGAAVPACVAVAALQAQTRAAGGALVRYPASWYATVAQDGHIVVVAGPKTRGVRPVATIMLSQGNGDPRALLDSAAAGLGRAAPLTRLGEQQVGPGRRARYYIRGQGAAAEYVMVGVAQGGGWIATMVALDLASDPELRTRAAVFQGILADLAMP